MVTPLYNIVCQKGKCFWLISTVLLERRDIIKFMTVISGKGPTLSVDLCISFTTRGRSQATLTTFCPFLTSYPHPVDVCEWIPLLKLGKICIFTIEISSTAYLPRLVNVVCECPPKLTSLVLLPIVRPTQFVTQCRNECLWYFKPVISWRPNILPKECTNLNMVFSSFWSW